MPSSRPSSVSSKKARRRIIGCWSGPISCERGSLSSSGMPDSAVEVAGHLLDFGVTANEWVG